MLKTFMYFSQLAKILTDKQPPVVTKKGEIPVSEDNALSQCIGFKLVLFP